MCTELSTAVPARPNSRNFIFVPSFIYQFTPSVVNKLHIINGAAAYSLTKRWCKEERLVYIWPRRTAGSLVANGVL